MDEQLLKEEEKSCPGTTSYITLLYGKLRTRPARRWVYVRAHMFLTAAVTRMVDGR